MSVYVFFSFPFKGCINMQKSRVDLLTEFKHLVAIFSRSRDTNIKLLIKSEEYSYVFSYSPNVIYYR